VAVASHDEKVDPVGACVGVKGVRIHAVVRELSNENIDVMEWSEDPEELIARALSPAEPTSVELNEEAEPPRARVEVIADEVSQAIGKRGVNIKLASELTGFEIDVYREIPPDEEDIDIEQFGDELAEDTIQKLKHIGCDTGKAVLELSADALSRRADLDRETAQRVLDIIETEFEKGPGIIEAIRHGRFTVESVRAPDQTETEGTAPAETGDPNDTPSASETVEDGTDAGEGTEDTVDSEADSTEKQGEDPSSTGDGTVEAPEEPAVASSGEQTAMSSNTEEETTGENADASDEAEEPVEESESGSAEPVREEPEVNS